MARRALAEKLPLLVASFAAALAFYYLRWVAMPGLYLIPVKGAAVGLLAAYLWLRHKSRDARLMAAAFAAAALADMAIEIDFIVGGALFTLYHLLAIAVYVRNIRPSLATSQKWAVVALLLLTPLIVWQIPSDPAMGALITPYGLALGAMAAGAWASVFPRYRVGAGAVLFVVSDFVLFSDLGPLAGSVLPVIFGWPLYYLAQFLIAVGVAQTLHKRDPELRIVVNN
jgi:hypothetical protein